MNSNLKLIGSDCDLSQFVGFKLNIKEGKHFIQNAFQTKRFQYQIVIVQNDVFSTCVTVSSQSVEFGDQLIVS